MINLKKYFLMKHFKGNADYCFSYQKNSISIEYPLDSLP